MQRYDVIVIGGGIIGCFTARNLCRRKIRIALAEAADSVCTGITRANSGICYAGYDHARGSVKATFTVEANHMMAELCDELEVPFERPGGLMTAVGPLGERVLKKKLEQGLEKGVTGLRIISGEEAREMEPMLNGAMTCALYSPTTGILNPWQTGIAAFENACENGCTPLLNTKIRAIRKSDGGYVLSTDHEEFFVRAVINCAGLYADQIREMVFRPSVRLRFTASDYLVFDRSMRLPKHVLFSETEGNGKGITVVPTTEGDCLIESRPRELTAEPFATDQSSIQELYRESQSYLNGLDLSGCIRSFGAVRPNPYRVVLKNGEWVPDESTIGSFIIETDEPGFISALGIKTPGLTCADQLGRYLADRTAEYLDARENPGFKPGRRGIMRMHSLDPETRSKYVREECDYGAVICRCRDITRGEILEAVRRGADTVEKIKRYLGTGMGLCQGSRCTREIESILKSHANGNS